MLNAINNTKGIEKSVQQICKIVLLSIFPLVIPQDYIFFILVFPFPHITQLDQHDLFQ